MPSRVLASKEDPRGGPAPWILSHSNFRSGTLILSFEGWAHWILFSSYLRFGTYLIFSKVQPLDFSSNLLWLQFQRDLGAPAPEVQNICFSCLSKFEGWAPDFSSTLARFYRGPMCEINSKGSDPPRAPPGPLKAFYSKEDSRGARPLDFIWSQLEVRPFDVMKVGFLNFIFILVEAWYLFCFQMPAPFSLGPTYTLDWKGKKKQPWLMNSTAKLASNCNKGAWNLLCWALLACLSNSPLQISSPWNFIVFELWDENIEFDPNKKAAKSCASSVPG